MTKTYFTFSIRINSMRIILHREHSHNPMIRYEMNKWMNECLKLQNTWHKFDINFHLNPKINWIINNELTNRCYEMRVNCIWFCRYCRIYHLLAIRLYIFINTVITHTHTHTSNSTFKRRWLPQAISIFHSGNQVLELFANRKCVGVSV